MKRPISLALLALGICAIPAFAVLDTNENGLSDLWEMTYNNGNLFGSSFTSAGDDDTDGWTNAQEAAAGTDPFDANPPDGHLRPLITHIPAVWEDTNSDGIPDAIVTPEALTLTWPTITGKQYTLMVSPDLVEWLPVDEDPYISSGLDVEYSFVLPNSDKLFWRVKVEDVDSDGDGLTDAEEAELGLDPNNPETMPGLSDSWVAKNFTSELIGGGVSAVDSDPDGDGLTNEQEQFLQTDPNVSDNPGILQDSIRNGNFSHPLIGSGKRSEITDPDWDYWEGLPADDDGKTSWTAVVGTNIEYQTITPKDGCGQYVELKAEPENHYGVKQTVGTRIGVTYIFALDCRARAEIFPGTALAPEESNFEIRIEGTTQGTIIKTVDFSATGTPTPPGAWTTVPVVFTANNVIVKISLVPLNNPNNKMGGMVDNVNLLPVDIDDNTFATGVDDVSITSSDPELRGYQDQFWIMAPCGGQEYNGMRFKIPFEPSSTLKIETSDATPDPVNSSLGNANPGPVVTWKGNGSSSLDHTPVWKIGHAEVPVELPIRVKNMKYRTVKVAVYPVRDPQSSRAIVPLPAASVLQAKLDETFGVQLNAWISLDIRPQQNYDYDPDGDGYGLIIETPHLSQMVDQPAFNVTDADIRVFVIDNVYLRKRQENVPGTMQDEIYGYAIPSATAIINAGNPTEGVYSNQKIVDTLAHEIGHLLVGEGHPSDYNMELDLGGNHGGPAPLPGTNLSARLMSGLDGPDARVSGAKFLVKTEWDIAEERLNDLDP